MAGAVRRTSAAPACLTLLMLWAMSSHGWLFVGGRAPAARPAKVVRRIAEGDMLPSVDVEEGKPGETVNILELFKGKKGILFAVPGAFTPTCSEKHLPGFISGAEELKAAGAEVIACISVNDPFVMGAWGKQQEAEGKVRMLADSKLELTKALDMEFDLTDALGTVRSKRYAMLVDDGKVTKVGMDDDSFAPVMLEALKR